ncbi:hypothetical protein MAY76_17460 [Edwardsiella ictaluri]|nr:hypothetical protein [Edwardsiella ictaluri]WFO11530.1 hypothetical protein MAY76_17460 [Edwardsiella ictaluri]
MPTPVIAQPINKAAGLATSAMFCGRLNTPAPSIELNTSAVRAVSPSFFFQGKIQKIDKLTNILHFYDVKTDDDGLSRGWPVKVAPIVRIERLTRNGILCNLSKKLFKK